MDEENEYMQFVSPQSQENEYMQFVPGKIKEHESVLQGAVKSSGTLENITHPFAHLGGFAQPSPAMGAMNQMAMSRGAEALPAVGQLAGGIYGYPGAVAGGVGGDVVKEMLEENIGKDRFSPKDIGKNAVVTAGTEAAGRGIGKLFMGKAASREAVKRGFEEIVDVKQGLGQLGESIPELSIPKDQILANLQTEFAKTRNPMGAGATVFKKWINYLSDPNVTHIDPNTAMQMENEFGQAAKYMNPKGFWENLFYNMKNPVKQPYLNESVKAGRNEVSGVVNNMADQIGRPDFANLSRKFSEGKYDLAGEPKGAIGALSKGIQAIRDVGGGAAIGHYLGNNALLGAGVGMLDIIRSSPAVQDAIYKSVGKTGVGRGATVGISELLRRNTKTV